MPSSEFSEIKELLNSLNGSGIEESIKSLKRIKSLVLNLKYDHIRQLFFVDKENLNNLFVYTFDNENTSKEYNLIKYNEGIIIFEKILSSFLNLHQIFEIFQQELQFIFSSQSYENFQLLSLKTLIEMTKKSFPDSIEDRQQENQSLYNSIGSLLPLIIKQIPQASPKFNELFIVFMANITQINEVDFVGGKLLLNDAIAKCLLDVMKINQIQFYRVFELIIKISTFSSDNLNECEKYFNLNMLIENQLSDNNSDILSKLNCLDQMKSLGEAKHGFKFLEKYFKHLLQYLDGRSEDIINEKFLVPGILKLFGSLSYYYPKEMHNNYAQFYIYILNNILLEDASNPDVQMKIELALDTLSIMFKNNEAKHIIYNNHKDLLVNRVFKRILKLLQYSINNLRLLSIEFLSSLVAINFKKNLISNNINFIEASELALNLFDSFISNLDSLNKNNSMEILFNILMNYAKQPFMELRLKSQDCFQSFTQSKWGLNFLLNLSNSGQIFVYYLTDRSTELEKEGRINKYELVKLVASSEFILEFIEINQLASLNKYVKEGPYYRESEMAVEFQSA